MAAIKRVWGRINDTEVTFELNEEGRYQANVAAPEASYYSIELYAEDEAGNQTFAAETVTTLDLRTLKTVFSMLDFQTLLVAPEAV